MFNNYSTSFLLNLKDPNIDFSDSTLKFVEINGVKTIQISAVLKNKPCTCSKCGSHKINVHGYKISNIKLQAISGYNAILALSKQRYQCQACNKTFMAKTSIVNDNCYISNSIKQSIALEAQYKISEKDIAKKFNVSHNTVNRILNSFKDIIKINFNYLPECLCFDEFKSTKDADGSMSFIYVDGETHQLLDIVEDRKLANLIKYFQNFSRKARNNVKYIVMDMYTPYIKLAKTCFPNAKIIFDRFHIVNLISRSLNKTRIKLMNKNKLLYNKLKKYWKLFLKADFDIDSNNYFYCPCFRGMRTQRMIIDWLLSQDEELKATYKFYQDILYAIKNRNVKFLEKALNDVAISSVSDYMKTSIKTLKNNLEYIENAIVYKYSNGPVEGINNKIKTIKRIAFGYRSFVNFRVRIFIMNSLFLHKKVA